MSITKSNTRMLEGEDLTLTGSLGIGTSSPTSVLDVRRGDTDGKIAEFHQSTGYGLAVSSSESVAKITSGYNQAFAFETGTTPTERMRLTANSSGSILYGKTTTATTTSGIETRTIGSDAGRTNISTSGGEPFYFYYSISGAEVGSITHGSTSTSFNTSSDYRLKENVVDITDGITRVKQLEPKKFNFIADAGTTVDGFIAHEAQAVVPESVTGTKDEVDDEGNPVMQGIDQAKLVPLLTAALKEAIAKIEVLETKVEALENA